MTEKHQQKLARLRARREEFIAIIYSEMHRLSAELHNGEYAPSQAEFGIFGADGMPNRHDLHVIFGKWENVAAACGLQAGTDKFYYDKKQEREAQAAEVAEPVRYTVRDDELLAATYRPPVKVRREDKLRAEELCAGIADERERKRVWFSALGYPEQFVDAWT